MNKGQNEDPNKTSNRGPNDRPYNEGDLVKEKLLEISNWATSKRSETLTMVQSDQVNKAVDRILALL